LYPEVAKEWHPIKNDKKPEETLPRSDYIAWWKCPKGHEWQAVVKSRTKNCGCPYCSGRKADENNNLTALYPHLMEQWHQSKNGDLNPKDLSPGSAKKVWWTLPCCGHEWFTEIRQRAGRTKKGQKPFVKKTKCPKCSLFF